MDFVSVKDAIDNSFCFTVQRHVLRDFGKALQTRTIALSACKVPTKFACSDALLSDSSMAAGGESKYQEAVAIVLYHFIMQDLWNKSTTLLELDVPDYEDECRKAIRVMRLKHPICLGSVAFGCRAGSYYHFTLLSTNGFREALNRCVGTGESVKLVNLNDRKVRCGDDDYDGKAWSIGVELFRADADVETEGDMTLLLSVRTRSQPFTSFRTARVKVPPPPYEADDLPGDVVVKAIPMTKAQLLLQEPRPLPVDPSTIPLPPGRSTGPSFGPEVLVKHAVTHVVLPAEEANKLATAAGRASGGAAAASKPTDLRLTPKVVVPAQDNYARDGKFSHYFWFIIPAVNTVATEPRSLRRAPLVEYRDRDGNWQPCEHPLLGTDHNGQRDVEDNNLSFTPGQSLTACVRAHIACLGETGRTSRERARIHQSLPNPMTFRLTLQEEMSGAFHALTMQCANEPMDLDTADSCHKNWCGSDEGAAKTLPLFLTADDADRATREVAGCYASPEGFHVRRPGSYLTLTLSSFRKWAYDVAKKCRDSGGADFQSEMCLDDWSTANVKAYILMHRLGGGDDGDVDNVEAAPYGVKLVVTNGVAKSEGSCHIDLSRLTKLDVEGRKEWFMAAETLTPKAPKPPVPAATSSSPRSVPPSSPSSVAASIAATPSSVAGGAASPPRSASQASTSLSTEPPARRNVSYTLLLTEKLGEGTYGIVYKGFDNEMGQHVAVKELRGLESSEALSKALQEEFGILTRLNHPHIVRVLSVSLDAAQGVARIIMEWMPSGSLASILKRNGHRLHEGVIRRYMSEALKGLAYLHENSVVHRDIKPANLLVAADGSVRVADFGCSKFAAGHTGGSAATHRLVGTPLYMAPEAIETGAHSPASDIWALACIVVELATGLPPWHHLGEDKLSNVMSILFHICNSQPPNHCPLVPPHLSAGLRGVLARCFSKGAAQRPTAAQLLGDPYFTAPFVPQDAESVEAFQQNAVAPAMFRASSDHPATGGGGTEEKSFVTTVSLSC